MRVGRHLSIAGGFSKAARYAVRLELEALQMFSRSPRGGNAKSLDPADVQEFKQLCQEHDISPAVIHSPYFVNLASSDEMRRGHTVDTLVGEVLRAAELGAEFIVTHLGSSAEKGAESLVSRALDQILVKTESADVVILLENTAGQGRELGHTFAPIGSIIANCDQKHRLGLCFDTCHAFAAGYDLTCADAFERMLDEIDGSIGLERLKVVHANDSKHPVGSRKDRHEYIGKGHIGVEGVQRVMRAAKINARCAILETPMTTFEADLQDVLALKAIR